MKASIIILLSIIFFSCKNVTKPESAALIGDSLLITFHDVDSRIEQELYSDLHRIYLRRLKSLDEILDEKIISIEANKTGKSKELLFKRNHDLHNNAEEIEKYKVSSGIMEKIPYFSGYLTYINVNTKFGQELLKESYQKFVDKQYLDELRKKYKIKTFIFPPLPPKINLDSLLVVHYKGNLSAKITILIISDVECSTCREATPIQLKLFEKYKDKIRFGYCSYSSHVNLGIKAIEAATKQNRFWEMYNEIIEHPFSFDTLKYINFASELRMDTIRFRNDLRDEKLTKILQKNFLYLQNKKIFATPTILLNNRIIPDIFNEDQICVEINKLLNEVN